VNCGVAITMANLNARIVARLPPADLRQSCHDVFRDEVANISDRLREATEAMGRLKKVEAAVSRLQQGKTDYRRSEGLVALVADTESIKSELMSKLHRMKLDLRASAVNADEVSRVDKSGPLRTPRQ
jgi:hypothetical protein